MRNLGKLYSDTEATDILLPVSSDTGVRDAVILPPPKEVDFIEYEVVDRITYTYTGQLFDNETSQPVPFASVELYQGSQYVNGTVTDSNGKFSITIDTEADLIQFSHVNYQPESAPAENYNNSYYHLGIMEPDNKDLDPVIVTSTPKKNKNMIFWALLATAAIADQNKKKVAKIETAHVLTAGVAVAMFLGFDTIKKMFEGLGFWNSKDTKDLDEQAANPHSPWSPNFWRQGPAGTLLITRTGYENMLDEIKDAWGYWNDDEHKVIAVFKRLKTQSQLSYFADLFNQDGNGDLLSYLRGNAYPNDRLSDSEVAEINSYIQNLPKYIP